ncbi:YceD family protein [Porticoccus litoralis]|uniref:Large ribosomal RNA subunit accumulation protein YceD n=1 Tax=Porticoccus litoralis TaxID=434086 RepID=A0AAW8B1E1_9GAMM|nr:YceD family protein [Porticoccus litoralis]MDP1519425.1 YceD family protein [Porticoccus litoralis]TNE91775.1 MAG: nucleic acid-binding protein [Gammaproteobacteria bacterium]
MTTPPQRSQLPRILDPRRLANQGEVLSGQVSAAHCERLRDAVLAINVPIQAELVFELAEQGRKVVAGHVDATVEVACQRCLQPMTLPLTVDFRLGIVWSEEEAKSLPKDLDPWVVEQETADLSAMVEDELLLALPFVTYHPQDTCQAETHVSAMEEPGASEKENPFSILEQLKNSGPDN